MRNDVRAARRYMHRMGRMSECYVGWFCWSCAWRTITGADQRARRAFRARADEASRTLTPIVWRLSDERRVTALERGVMRQTLAMGAETCPNIHDCATCNHCRAAV